jgi:dTDP-4-dehydrorhamnose 3,5-epimerase
VNCTVSHRNVVRGVHFTRLVGQAKFVCCMSGSMIDVVYDTRIGSPTYGQYDAIRLEPDTFQIVLIPEGVAHGVASLADRTTVFYLCSAPYDPDNEFGVHPMDPELGIDWRGMLGGADPILSERDSTAPKLAEVREEGLLPPYEQCLEVYGQAEGTGGR